MENTIRPKMSVQGQVFGADGLGIGALPGNQEDRLPEFAEVAHVMDSAIGLCTRVRDLDYRITGGAPAAAAGGGSESPEPEAFAPLMASRARDLRALIANAISAIERIESTLP